METFKIGILGYEKDRFDQLALYDYAKCFIGHNSSLFHVYRHGNINKPSGVLVDPNPTYGTHHLHDRLAICEPNIIVAGDHWEQKLRGFFCVYHK